METYRTEKITCPYCGYIDEDSWEYDDSGTTYCNHCEEVFHYERIIDVKYTTVKLTNENENENLSLIK